MHISNDLGLVSGQQFYVCTDMPNYDIDMLEKKFQNSPRQTSETFGASAFIKNFDRTT